VKNVTDGIGAVAWENLRPYTIITIDEAKSGDLALGGHCLTVEDMRAIVAGPRAVAPTAMADAAPAEASLA
jgi:hypothetical protein